MQYREIIDSLKTEIDILRDQLLQEQSKKSKQKTNKRAFNDRILDVKLQKDEILNLLEQEEGVDMNASQIVDSVNYISDISVLGQNLDFSIENAEEITADLEAVKHERELLEQKLNNNDISICQAETSYFDKICAQLYQNFEEEWDITHSIAEINELQKENNQRIMDLANDMEELIEQKEQITDDKETMKLIGQQLNEKLAEIENLETAMQENANVLNEWISAKKINEDNRSRIQAMFTNIQSNKKYMIQKQIITV